MGTVKIIKAYVLVVATSHLITGKLYSSYFFHTLPHHENDIARHFKLVKGQGCLEGFSNTL